MSQFKFSELEQRIGELGDDIQEFVERVVSGKEKKSGFRPALDVLQDDEQITLLMDLPGMDKDDVSIALKNQVLTISGTRKSDYPDGKEFLKQERKSGAFSRSFAVPAGVNSSDIKAAFRQGVLQITVPLKGEAEQPDTISID